MGSKTNFFIKLFVALIKPPTHHGVTYLGKQKYIYLRKKNKNERQNEKNLLPLHWFFTNDLTTTKTFLVTYDGKIISKSLCTSQICWPFASKAKC
jgi:hypothetical protein